MRGDKVIVRAYGDEPLVRVVWDVLPGAVLITNEDQFPLLEAKQPGIAPLGFPSECVFCYDEARWHSFQKRPHAWNWTKLRPYTYEGDQN